MTKRRNTRNFELTRKAEPVRVEPVEPIFISGARTAVKRATRWFNPTEGMIKEAREKRNLERGR